MKIFSRPVWLFAFSFLMLPPAVYGFTGDDLEFTSLNPEEGVIIEGRGLNRLAHFELRNTTRSQLKLERLILRNVGSVVLDHNYQFLELRNQYGFSVGKSESVSSQTISFELPRFTLESEEAVRLSVWGRSDLRLLGRTIKFQYLGASLSEDKSDVTSLIKRRQRVFVPHRSSTRRGAFGRTSTARLNKNYGSLRRRRAGIARRQSPMTNSPATNRLSVRTPQSLSPQELRNKLLTENPYTRIINLDRPLKVETLWALLGPGSTALDKNNNGFDNEVEDFEIAFDHFTLAIDGRRVAQSLDIRKQDDRLWIVFTGPFSFERQHNIAITPQKSILAEDRDRAVLIVSDEYSFRDKTRLPGNY